MSAAAARAAIHPTTAAGGDDGQSTDRTLVANIQYTRARARTRGSCVLRIGCAHAVRTPLRCLPTHRHRLSFSGGRTCR